MSIRLATTPLTFALLPSDVTIVHVRGYDPALILLRLSQTCEHRINKYNCGLQQPRKLGA